MHMRVQTEPLVPGMQHTEKADLCAEVSRVTSDFEQGFCAGAQQQAVDELFVLERQACQLRRQCKDHMHVARREQLFSSRCDPAIACRGLTLWAVAVATAIVGDGAMPAAGAFVEMTAQCGGTTPLNGSQHFDMLPTEPVAISFDESPSRSAEDVGHLQRRPAHLVLAGWLVVQRERIQRTRCCAQVTFGKMKIDRRFFEVLMTEQELNGAEISAGFE